MSQPPQQSFLGLIALVAQPDLQQPVWQPEQSEQLTAQMQSVQTQTWQQQLFIFAQQPSAGVKDERDEVMVIATMTRIVFNIFVFSVFSNGVRRENDEADEESARTITHLKEGHESPKKGSERLVGRETGSRGTAASPRSSRSMGGGQLWEESQVLVSNWAKTS